MDGVRPEFRLAVYGLSSRRIAEWTTQSHRTRPRAGLSVSRRTRQIFDGMLNAAQSSIGAWTTLPTTKSWPKRLPTWHSMFGVNYLDRSATIILAGVMGFGSATSLG